MPQSFLNCTKLEVLDIGNNKINDVFPYWLGNLLELRVLVLRSNKLRGSVKGFESKESFHKLRILDLSINNFSGYLPARFFEKLNAMRNVGADEGKLRYLGEEYYQDSVLVTLKGTEIELQKILTVFTTIDFSSNGFDGEISQVIGKLHSLRLLNLTHNHFTRKIPSSLGNLAKLESLDLSSNNLAGKIPKQLASLTSLPVLNLSHNRLDGPIPQGPQVIHKEDSYIGLVIGLSIGYMVFTSGEPLWFMKMVVTWQSKKSYAKQCPQEQSLALLQFKQLFFFNRYYFGRCRAYPKTMSWKWGTDCCSWEGVTCDMATGDVISLDLSCSGLYGSIPSNTSLFDLVHLQKLNLANNDFNLSLISSGFSRFLNLTHLNLSYSNFEDSIPYEISRLSKLVSLDLSTYTTLRLENPVMEALVQNVTKLQLLFLDSVDMSTVVPGTLKNLSTSLVSLSLTYCRIQGEFPENIFRLPNLQMVRLKFNSNLSGVFPRSNWTSPLRYLDVSGTGFSGQLPDSICNLRHLRELKLYKCNFYGFLPASLGNVTQLAVLSLSSNSFSGHIPPSLSNLHQLINVDLRSNSFHGQIPDIMNLTRVAYLDISNNQLTGSIPSHGSGLQNLAFLRLYNNTLSGTIPSWLFSLPLLRYMDLSDNQLTGHLDAFPSKSLQNLYLTNNRLHGSIPSSIFELANLTDLRLASNNFSGIVEPYMLAKLVNLVALELSHNSLSFGTTSKVNSSFPQIFVLRLSACNISAFPSFLRSLKELAYLDLSENNIDGQIPNWMWEVGKDTLSYLDLSHNFITEMKQIPWKNLKYLKLQSNLLHGPLPVPPPRLQFLLASNNQFTGEIIPSICSSSTLEVLGLSDNGFSGTIPVCIGNFSVLDLRNNRLNGTIPEAFAEANLLRTLNLNNNELEGPVPKSLVNCTKLEVLDIGNNKVKDVFPYWLGNLPELQVLVLRSNKFHSSMREFEAKQSFPKLRIIDLSHNNFTGPLPARFFENLNGMRTVGETERKLQYVGETFYQDSVVVTLKGAEIELQKILTVFTTIDFSSNDFHGEIPEVIGNLHSLRLLNLSHNYLTVRIPFSLGNLINLESLDLSSNDLSGKIPMQLTSLTYLSVLNLSYNQLEGPIPQGPQFSTFQNHSYIGNLGLCGFPLTKQCGKDDPPELVPTTSSWFDWKVAKMGYGSGLVIGLSIGYMVFVTGRPLWFVKMFEKKQSKKKKIGIVNTVLSILCSPVIALAFSELCKTLSS
ncbi:receptor-like protein Cf-9 homolog [Citrus clementina]|uniref:receptor-like protein Cf-9 homolog n=1 Tax=Citrus clementina TaxID=85681 RepID=UPI000CECEDC6|nr:receptor-like protein Cf-9 homolog [Citrus x clementina]